MTDEQLSDMLATYRPNQSAIDLVKRANLVLLVGISGAGKDTLKHALLKESGYYNFISHTTRAPRANHGVMEIDGEDYHFITKDDAATMLARGDFIEAKQYSANIYGTTAEGLKPSVDGGMIAVNDVEVQGVKEYIRMSNDVHCVFLLPPSYDEWQRRLHGRYAKGTFDAADRKLRLQTAKNELAFALDNDYFKFVINEDMQRTIECVADIVQGVYDEARQSVGRACAERLLRDISTH